MTSHSTEHHSVEESPEKRVQLPTPDATNITVLTRELPNEPILPWHRFDSPWLSQEAEETAGTLEEFVERNDVEIQAIDEAVIETRVEALEPRDKEPLGEEERGFDLEELDSEFGIDDLDEEEAESSDSEADEHLGDEALETEDWSSDEIANDAELPERDQSQQSETRQEHRRVYLPEPDRSNIDPHIPLGTLADAPPFNAESPELEDQDIADEARYAASLEEAGGSTVAVPDLSDRSGNSFPLSTDQSSIRMDGGAVSLADHCYETDSAVDPGVELDSQSEAI